MPDKPVTQQRQTWLLFFFLGLIMLNFPFLQIFNRPEPIFGIPVLIIYLFCGWPISIVVIFIFSRKLRDKEDQSTENR